METAKEIVLHSSKKVNIDSLDETIEKKYPLLAEITAELAEKENEMKEMVHAFYERKKANIIVGKEKGSELTSKFITIWQEKKRLEQLELQEKAKTPEYQEMFASLCSININAKD